MIWPQLLQYSDLGVFLLRLAIAVIFIYHAIPKLKNSKGLANAMGMSHMPWFPGLLGALELVSAVGLILGIAIQLAALVLAIIMAGAIYFKVMKWKIPFSGMNQTGWEFDLILLAGALALLLGGGGEMLVLWK